MYFALNGSASLNDVRRKTQELIKNGKGYKIPKEVLGETITHIIEYGEQLNAVIKYLEK